jgi:hypothetical protein
LDFGGSRIEEFDPAVDFFAELVPVHIYERVGAGYLPHDIIGDPGAFPEGSEVQLPDPAVFADVMDQVESVPFAPKKSHSSLLAQTSNL